MPYLHWATEGERQSLNAIAAAVQANRSSANLLDEKEISDKTDRYEKLLWAYLLDKHPLHVRRTLDQSYYSTLKNTEIRDQDQVPHKFFKQHFPDSAENGVYPVLMVDQLWLWILGGSRFTSP